VIGEVHHSVFGKTHPTPSGAKSETSKGSINMLFYSKSPGYKIPVREFTYSTAFIEHLLHIGHYSRIWRFAVNKRDEGPFPGISSHSIMGIPIIKNG
jgi:hypothetical protein